jgi:hypothetical protein
VELRGRDINMFQPPRADLDGSPISDTDEILLTLEGRWDELIAGVWQNNNVDTISELAFTKFWRTMHGAICIGAS